MGGAARAIRRLLVGDGIALCRFGLAVRRVFVRLLRAGLLGLTFFYFDFGLAMGWVFKYYFGMVNMVVWG